VAASSEHGNESWGSISAGNFLTSWATACQGGLCSMVSVIHKVGDIRMRSAALIKKRQLPTLLHNSN
jgi:hypothetical protein